MSISLTVLEKEIKEDFMRVIRLVLLCCTNAK